MGDEAGKVSNTCAVEARRKVTVEEHINRRIEELNRSLVKAMAAKDRLSNMGLLGYDVDEVRSLLDQYPF